MENNNLDQQKKNTVNAFYSKVSTNESTKSKVQSTTLYLILGSTLGLLIANISSFFGVTFFLMITYATYSLLSGVVSYIIIVVIIPIILYFVLHKMITTWTTSIRCIRVFRTSLLICLLFGSMIGQILSWVVN